jgi:hypothetical protein
VPARCARDCRRGIRGCDQVGSAEGTGARRRDVPAQGRSTNSGQHGGTPYPHGCRRAVRDHARLGYAGGSGRPLEPVRVGRALRRRRFNGELAARNRRNFNPDYGRQDAKRDRHVPAARAAVLLDVIIEVVVVHRMTMYCTVGVDMRDDVAVLGVDVLITPCRRVAMRVTMVIAAAAAGRGFGRGHQRALQDKRRPLPPA